MASRPPGPLPSAGSSTELDRVRAIVSSFFPVYETRMGPQSVLLAVHVDPATLEGKFDALDASSGRSNTSRSSAGNRGRSSSRSFDVPRRDPLDCGSTSS